MEGNFCLIYNRPGYFKTRPGLICIQHASLRGGGVPVVNTGRVLHPPDRVCHSWIHILHRPGLMHTRPVSDVLFTTDRYFHLPGRVLLRRITVFVYICNRPGFSMDRPVLIYLHYHLCFQQIFRPNTFALLASPAHSMTWSHFANGGISGTGSFPYPSMRTLLTRSGAVNYIFPTPTGSFSKPTGCIHMTKKL